MPDDRWTVGEDVSEVSFPEGNRHLDGCPIEADGRELPAGDRSIEINTVLVLQGLAVDLQDVLARREKTVLAQAQAVGKVWDGAPQTPGITAVKGRQVTGHREGDARAMDGVGVRMTRWLLAALQELAQIRLGEAALTPAAHATAGQKPCVAPAADRGLADPPE